MKNKELLISLHMPKSAGTSFKILLERYFNNSFLGDYSDLPLNKSFEIAKDEANKFSNNLNYIKRWKYYNNNIKCIHGHFLIKKYIKFKRNEKTIFITWLREPLARMQSHYDYWFRTYNQNTTKATLHKKVVEENWSFDRFCFSEEMKNIYSKFFYDFSLDNFNFIGLTEFFNEDTMYFMKKYLNESQEEIPFSNSNPNKQIEIKYRDSFLIKFRDFHSKDYEIYDYAIKKRESRLAKNDIT